MGCGSSCFGDPTNCTLYVSSPKIFARRACNRAAESSWEATLPPELILGVGLTNLHIYKIIHVCADGAFSAIPYPRCSRPGPSPTDVCGASSWPPAVYHSALLVHLVRPAPLPYPNFLAFRTSSGAAGANRKQHFTHLLPCLLAVQVADFLLALHRPSLRRQVFPVQRCLPTAFVYGDACLMPVCRISPLLSSCVTFSCAQLQLHSRLLQLLQQQLIMAVLLLFQGFLYC